MLSKLRVLTFTLLLLANSNFIHGQAPSIQWQKNIGGYEGDNAFSIKQTSDGGFIVAGRSNLNDGDVSGNHGGSDFWIAKLTNTGTITWQKSYGGSGNETARSIVETTDGGYIIAGETNSHDGDVTGFHPGTQGGGPTNDYWVIKITSSGILQWQKCLGGTLNDIAFSIVQTSDGGYAVAGSTDSFDEDVHGYHQSTLFHFTTDFWVVKLNNSGNIEWDKAYGGNLYEEANSIKQTIDGGYVVAGYTDSYDSFDVKGSHVPFSGAANADFWVIKLGATGNLEWQKCLGGFGSDRGYSIMQSTDGGYIVVGHTNSTDGDITGFHGTLDIWVVKINNTGNIEWQKCYGGSSSESATEVQQTTDGGYIICGHTFSTDGDVKGSYGIEDYWVLKINATGALEWQKCLGGTLYDDANSIKQTTDGGFIVAGSATSSDGNLIGNRGNADYWIIKLGPPPCISSIKISATDTQLCSGSSVTFNSLIENGGTEPVYQWLVNGVEAGTNNSSFTTANLKDNDSVVCRLTSNAGCLINHVAISDTIVVKVSEVSNTGISITASSSKICRGSPIIFTALIANDQMHSSLQWTKNGINVGSDSTLYIDSLLNNGDTIICKLTSLNVCTQPKTVISNPIGIIVDPIFNTSIIISASANNICPGTRISFNANVTNGGLSPIYQWKKNGVDVGMNDIFYSDNTSVNGDTIFCIMKSDALCAKPLIVKSNSLVINVKNDFSKASLGNDTSICTGSSILLKPQNGFASYLWQNGSTDSIFKVSDPGVYSVMVYDLCGNKSIDTLVVSLFPNTAFLPHDTAICKYGNLVIKPKISLKNYLWNTNATTESININTSGSYWLKATDSNNCISIDTIVIFAKNCMQGFYIPNAFSPNNDSENDTFRPLLFGTVTKFEFIIYNRFGEIVFKTNNYLKSWNGRIKGELQPTGVFVWLCTYQFKDEPAKTEKGIVTLIR